MPGNSSLPGASDEIERGVLNGDDRVEAHVLVFQAEKFAEGRLVCAVRKPCLVDVLRVVVHAPKTLFEDSRQFTLADSHDLGIAPRRVHDEHLLLGLRPRGPDRTEREHQGKPQLQDESEAPLSHAVQKSISAVSLMSRGVMIACGGGQVPPGTKVELYDSTALEFSAL